MSNPSLISEAREAELRQVATDSVAASPQFSVEALISLMQYAYMLGKADGIRWAPEPPQKAP